MSNKKLLMILVVLTIIFAALWAMSPTTGQKVKVTTTQTTVAIQGGDYTTTLPDGDLPSNYIPVAGLQNIYKVVDNGVVSGYKEKTKTGFVDYDINKPAFFEKIEDSDEIYGVRNDNGEFVEYRKYNGKEWDIVNEQGETLFAIPDKYERVNQAENIYSYKDKSGKTKYAQIVKFADESYGWKEVN